jgi:hypothetical protein
MSKRKLAPADLQVEPEMDGDLQVMDQEFMDEAAAVAASQDEAAETQAEQLPPAIPTHGGTDPEPPEEEEGANKKDPAAVQKLLTRVGQLGRDKGAGGKALVELARTLVEGAVMKVITEDDAERFYKRFRTASDKAAMLPDTKGTVGGGLPASADVQISKLKAFIRFGNHWPDDAESVMHRATVIHVGLLADEERSKSVKLRSTYAALNTVAVGHMRGESSTLESVKHGIAMSDEEIEGLFIGEEPKDKTAVDIVKSALDQCYRAAKGKQDKDGAWVRDKVDSMYLEEAVQNLRETINELDPTGSTLQAFDDKHKKKDDAAALATFRNALKPRRITYHA